ncbi:hypothetical protein BDZ89DRAFT_1141812 [Hymenopellis radicata]|nr:hypothetical protein BDZ89DRAFT_1141812 [Hymenopellis radicata]
MSRSTSNLGTPGLQRGQACIYCRRRKMRCDGARPICGQCSRSRRPDDCQYTDQGRSRMEILEESIARVEARIHELENPQVSENIGSPILLHQPYLQREAVPVFEDVPIDGWWTTPEPPVPMRTQLIDHFLTYASELGFFLNTARFRTAALGAHPLGNHTRPVPALLTAAYLWGIHFSATPSLIAHQGAFLSRALTQVVMSLSGSHPGRVMQTIQAEVLLSHYFLAYGRFLEGRYHISTALSIGMGAGLSKIRSRTPQSVPITALPAPLDAVEEGERVYACWTVLSLDKSWGVALASGPNVPCPTNHESGHLDTPWPLEEEDYEKGGYPTNMRSSHTYQNLLQGVPAGSQDSSTMSQFSKAALLWERANNLIGTWHTGDFTSLVLSTLSLNVPNLDMSAGESSVFQAAFSALDDRIEELKKSLTPPTQISNRTPSKLRRLFVAHSLTHSAILQLHGVFAKTRPESRQKVLFAARDIFRMVSATHLGSVTQFINPIMGTIWVSASQFLFEELDHLNSLRTPSGEAEGVASLKALIEGGLTDMMPFQRSCVLMKYQLSQIQTAYAEVRT